MLYPLFRVAVDSYHLFTKYQYDPVSVLAASKINLLPYQLEDFLNLLDIADSGRPVRVLIAYETGLGKTILAGLFIKEMVIRNPNTRILIVTPPNVQYQWQDELKNKFGMHVPLLTEADKQGKDPLKQKWLIASMDTLKGENWLRRVEDHRWDIVVVDELHRATIKNRRAQLIQVLRDRTKHMLALTATPHDGKEDQFVFRLSLINRNVDEQNWKEFVKKYTFRRRKRDVLDLEGRKIFPQKVYPLTIEIEPDEEEKEFYWEVEKYVRSYYKLAEEENKRSIGLVATIVGRAVSSSINAGVQVLKNRYRRLFEGFAEELEDAEDILDELKQAEEEGDDEKLEKLRMKIIESVPVRKDLVEKEKEVLERLITLGEKLLERGRDKKTERLVQVVNEHMEKGNKVIIFTQFLATLDHLERTFKEIYGENSVVTVHGGLTHEEKKNRIAKLWDSAKILIATDAAGESLNLQAANVVIHYEIPWNPVVYIQRVGRVYRYGQEKDIYIQSMLPVFKIERRVLEVILQKVETIEKDFDIGSVEIIGTIISERDIENEIWRAYVEDRIEDAGEEVSKKFDKGKSVLQKIRLVLEKAEAAKKHVRAEKLLEDRGIVEIITEEDLRKYLFYFGEAKLGEGKFYDEFTFFEIKDVRIHPEKILTEIKPSKAEILDLKDVTTLSEKELKLDNPAIRKALYIGMCQRGEAIFSGNEEGYGEIRLLKLFDFYGEPIYEIPVVVFNGSIKPFRFLQTLEPVILSDEIEKELTADLESKEIEIRDSSYISEVKEEQRLYLKERVNKVLDALSIEEEYYKRFLSDEQAKKKLQEIQEMKKKEYRRSLRIHDRLSEPIAKFWVLKPEKLTEMLHKIAEKTDDGQLLKEIESSIEDFDPELWKRKREVELAGMKLVMSCEEKWGRFPKDVSADGRGYDIESFDPNSGEKRRIEVKSFKTSQLK
ncbi:helicase-related protein [Archaeoglobus fulgidus]|uniref:ATP-dependent RNA helicase HepA, putative n=1 Tax=Archaeoglobus fulgidus (strain ATCC 49558 / DSM 4304 / JCM 9628 / NBRC 100126 / VC-16) TaxID=224325 RepID=O30320_ARCFU|nr:helicase-related protein [Archaeoglobus fulgidus]AAB91314.1 ATP-dependent RNA helicase HepA, putative [Archaeoglobus fulgidus DSM 4304]